MREPSKAQWMDAVTALPCLIVRNGLGALCGYAGVYRGHPLHGKSYDDVDLDAHCGLTFSGGCGHGEDESRGVCHVPEPGTSDDVWWFGFDCAHCNDLVPGMRLFAKRDSFGFELGEVYRDIGYVAAEVKGLALQLRELN